MQTILHNAAVVLPDRMIADGYVVIEDEKIAAVGNGAGPQGGTRTVDVGGAYVMPGIIDLHCDAIEKLVEPRPNVRIDPAVALAEADWRLAGNGITTEFHAVSLDDSDFGVRDSDFVWELAQVIRAATDTLVRHEIHARYEVTSTHGLEIVGRLIELRAPRLVSFMNHDPGQGQYTTEKAWRDYAKRTAFRTDDELDVLLAAKRKTRHDIPRRTEVVTQMARQAGLAIASHDDDTPEKVAQWPAMGVTVAEFPTKLSAAKAAHDAGLLVCMGAPNVLRGVSSGGNVSALEVIEAGVADALCSDYYPAAMLQAAFKLVRLGLRSLPDAVAMVTHNPARAVGLDDFGAIAVGKVADMIVVGLNGQDVPRVRRVIVGGTDRVVIEG